MIIPKHVPIAAITIFTKSRTVGSYVYVLSSLLHYR